MAKHVRFGGSTIARTIACPGWSALAEDLPPQAESEYAAEGTLLHNCMEEFYTFDTMTAEMLEIGREYNGVVLTQALVTEKLVPAINKTEEILKKYDIADYICEPFVSISDDIGGSIDFLGVSDDLKTVIVLDYKFGFNFVDAVENKQLLFYALCASLDTKTSHLFEHAERFVSVIVQPTTESGYTLWEYTKEELDAFERLMVEGIKQAKAPDPAININDHCKWCPAEHICPQKSGQALKAKHMNPAQIDQLAEMLPIAEELESWIKKVKKAAHEQLELGTKIEGYKLVHKRATRAWTDPEQAAELIRHARRLKIQDAYDMKLKSPPQMEKLCKEKGFDFHKFDDYISYVSSGTTMAKASDKRPEVSVAVNKIEELRKISS